MPARPPARCLRRAAIAASSLAWLLSLAARSRAQERTTDGGAPPVLLDETVVTATRAPSPLRDVPAAISVVDERAIQEARPTVSLAEPLNRVPGVFVQDSGNYAQDVRLQIRGFGTRAAFGIREIRVLVDGLPETLPDGQTDLDDVDLASIARIEVLRGPASSLYGNAAGGVIQLFTEDAPVPSGFEARVLAGSFGLLKTVVSGGASGGGADVFAQGSYFSIRGDRDHQVAYDGIVNAKLHVRPADGTDVTFLVSAVDAPLAQDPGALTGEQVRQSPHQARDLNVALDAGEAVQQGRIGAVASHVVGPHALSAYAYALYRDFDSLQPIPPEQGDGAVAFHRTSPGGGFRYDLSQPVAGIAQTFTTGLDVQTMENDRRRLANVDGRRGALGVSERESVDAIGAYVRESLFPLDGLEVAGGIRWDDVHFAVDVSFPPSGAGSGTRTFDEWSPGGGLLWTIRPWLSAYANVGTAFQVPTTTELENPDGPGLNPAIRPQTATSWEIGARAGDADLAEGALAAYVIDIDAELVPFESPSGRVAFRNSGSSRRLGLELEGHARLTRWLSTAAGVLGLGGAALPGDLEWTGSLTALDATYRSYRTDGGNFSGNDEPGIPGWQVYQQLAWRHPVGAFVALEAFVADGYFVDDANTARAPSYGLLSLRAGLRREIAAGISVQPFLGLQNLTDASYAGTVRLNALGGRFFEPAPGFNVYGGIALAASL
ncbi:MAG TPA: TonB-dependent receptor [Candidatus Binatia bacterium]|nr:TonB-dependent receptor [Candidatus Binatia bacterium]